MQVCRQDSMEEGDPSSLSKEKGQYGAGGDDDSQHSQGLEKRAHFLHGRHPPHMKDSREMPFRKAGIFPRSERTIMDGQHDEPAGPRGAWSSQKIARKDCRLSLFQTESVWYKSQLPLRF